MGQSLATCTVVQQHQPLSINVHHQYNQKNENWLAGCRLVRKTCNRLATLALSVGESVVLRIFLRKDRHSRLTLTLIVQAAAGEPRAAEKMQAQDSSPLGFLGLLPIEMLRDLLRSFKVSAWILNGSSALPWVLGTAGCVQLL